MSLNDAVIESQNWLHGAALLKNFYGDEIFFKIESSSAAFEDGKLTVSSDHEISMPFAKIGDSSMGLFYTTKENPRLSGNIGGMPLKAAIEMVLEVSSIDGILLQSDQDAWIAVKKEELRNLMNM